EQFKAFLAGAEIRFAGSSFPGDAATGNETVEAVVEAPEAASPSEAPQKRRATTRASLGSASSPGSKSKLRRMPMMRLGRHGRVARLIWKASTSPKKTKPSQ
ncbi:unnamed protein product, partial [Polarella glacialis]